MRKYIAEKVNEVLDSKIIRVVSLQRILDCGYVSAQILYDKMLANNIIEHKDSYEENILNIVKARRFLKKEFKKIFKKFNRRKENFYLPSVNSVFLHNVIGYDLVNAIITGNLLIGGEIGSGKTNLINHIICEIVEKYSKEDFNLILVDPKEIEFKIYRKIPHLIYPIIKDFKSFVEMSKLIEEEAKKRQKLFRKTRVKNIFEYNNKFYKIKMPFIVIIIDEIADFIYKDRYRIELIMKNIFNNSICYGISVVYATQAHYLLNEILKDNINFRCCFKTTSDTDSIMILEDVGAENLEEKGSMIIGNLKKQDLYFRQCEFLKEDKIKDILK